MSKNKTLLLEALDDVETVFAQYQVSFPLATSPIWVSDEMQTALEEDTSNMLAQYLIKAITIWGDENDFKHFLPTMLRMFAFDLHPFFSYDLLFSKMRYADFEHWPETEKVVIIRYCDRLWQYILDAFQQPDCVYGHVFIKEVFYPVRYLNAWEERLPELPALLHLADWIIWDYAVLIHGYKGIGSRTLYHDRWAIRKKTQDLLEQAFFDYMDTDFAKEFSYAAEQLKWIRWMRN